MNPEPNPSPFNNNFPTTFESQIQDSKKAVISEIFPERKNLFIAFGGIRGGLGITPFEFFNSTKHININKIYIRDIQQVWYQTGFQNISSDINSSVSFLKGNINNIQHLNNTIVAGNSMGGYAAILFGVLLKANTIHAFSPQTFINRFNRLKYFDHRWRKQIVKIYKLNTTNFLNLKEFLLETEFNSKIHIYYSINHRLDSIHAKKLADIKNVILHPYKEGGHSVVKYLRSSNKLIPLLFDQ